MNVLLLIYAQIKIILNKEIGSTLNKLIPL